MLVIFKSSSEQSGKRNDKHYPNERVDTLKKEQNIERRKILIGLV
jgi:hypothetical protein